MGWYPQAPHPRCVGHKFSEEMLNVTGKLLIENTHSEVKCGFKNSFCCISCSILCPHILLHFPSLVRDPFGIAWWMLEIDISEGKRFSSIQIFGSPDQDSECRGNMYSNQRHGKAGGHDRCEWDGRKDKRRLLVKYLDFIEQPLNVRIPYRINYITTYIRTRKLLLGRQSYLEKAFLPTKTHSRRYPWYISSTVSKNAMPFVLSLILHELDPFHL